MNAVHTNRYGDGDGLGWHFDNSEFFVNLILAQSANGGLFEYAPQSSEGHEAILAALGEGDNSRMMWRGRSAVASMPELRAGSLLLFRGQRVMHRVTPVRAPNDSEGARISAILNWATVEGGGMINEYTRRKFFGRTLHDAQSSAGAQE